MDTQERKIDPGALVRTLQVRGENLKPVSSPACSNFATLMFAIHPSRATIAA